MSRYCFYSAEVYSSGKLTCRESKVLLCAVHAVNSNSNIVIYKEKAPKTGGKNGRKSFVSNQHKTKQNRKD